MTDESNDDIPFGEEPEKMEPDRTIEHAMEKIRKKKQQQGMPGEMHLEITDTGLEPERGMEDEGNVFHRKGRMKIDKEIMKDLGYTTEKGQPTSIPLVEMEWRYDDEGTDTEWFLYYKQNRAIEVGNKMVILEGEWMRVPYKPV